MATLYELSSQAHELYELLQSEEIDDQTFTDTLEALGTEEKLESYCQIIGQLKSDVEMFKKEAERIAARKKTAEASIDRMKDAIMFFLKSSGKDKAKAGTFSVSLSSSTAVQINDESILPKAFLIEQPPKVDKMAIKKALQEGNEVEGAELIQNEGVRIR